MSRRTFPRFALVGLLAAALAGPSLGQSPSPVSDYGVSLFQSAQSTTPAGATGGTQAFTPAPLDVYVIDGITPPLTAAVAYNLGSAIEQASNWVPAEPAQYPQSVPITPPPPPVARGVVVQPSVVPTVVPAGFVPPPPALPSAPPVATFTRQLATPTVVVAPPVAQQPGCLVPPAPPVPQSLHFQVGVIGQPGLHTLPGTQAVRLPQHAPAMVPVSQPLPCCEAIPPRATSGTYYRELPGVVSAVTFKGNELTATVTVNDDGMLVTLTMTADCAMTKDGTVHGVVTGIDVDVTGGKDTPAMELAEFSMEVQTLVDQPFAFRCRQTDSGLMISNLRIASGPHGDADGIGELGMLLGKYKPAGKGQLPTPKPMNTRSFTGGMTLPSPRYLQHYPQYFPGDGQIPLSQEFEDVPIRPAPSACPPTLPCPTASVCLPPPCPAVPVTATPCPVPSSAVMLPPPRPAPAPPYPVPVVAVSHPVPVPAYPVPPTPIAYPTPVFTSPCPMPVAHVVPPPMPSQPRITPGTWYREVGPMVCAIAVKDGHLTITATMSGEENDKMITAGFVVTADCYLTRDGNGLVGVITGVDMLLEGATLPESGMNDMFEQLPKFQKSLVGQPFAVSFRVYDDVLMVGDLRIATSKDGASELLDLVHLLAGRYKATSEKGIPKPKPMKVKTCDSPKCIPPATTSLELTPPSPYMSTPVYVAPTGAQTTPSVSGPVVSTDGPSAPARMMPPPLPCEDAPIITIGGLIDPCYPERYIAPARAEATGTFVVQGRCDIGPSKPRTVSLADVVELTEAGASDDVIVNQIRTTGSTFTRLSPTSST